MTNICRISSRPIVIAIIAMSIGCSDSETNPAAPQSVAASVSADPGPPVIFLHYDYMVRDWSTPADTTTNFAPDPDDIAQVVAAFRRRGITLAIDPQHTVLPYWRWISFTPENHLCEIAPAVQVPAANFYELKAQYFHPKGNLPWHYVIFGHLGCDWYGQRTGSAELPGYNFMVTFPLPHRQCVYGTRVASCLLQAGTFMHELGHNLDLHHGGDEEENFKPNYVSVMNYLFQTGIIYTPPGDTYQFGWYWGSPPPDQIEHIAGKRLDYSGGELPALDELHLNEETGLGGAAGNTDLSAYQPSWVCGDYSGPQTIRVASGRLDWNRNGIIETDVAVDANWIWTSYFTDFFSWNTLCPLYNVGSDGHPLRDFDDWAHVRAFVRMPQYLDRTLRPLRIESDSMQTTRER